MSDLATAGIVLLSMAAGAAAITYLPPLFGMLLDRLQHAARLHYERVQRSVLNIGESLDHAALQMGYNPGDLDEMFVETVRAMHAEGLNPAEMALTLRSRSESALRKFEAENLKPVEPSSASPLPET